MKRALEGEERGILSLFMGFLSHLIVDHTCTPFEAEHRS